MSETIRVSGFQINAVDNVATLLDDAAAETVVELRGDNTVREVIATQPIQAGHKIALCDMPAGTHVMKYGFPIGETTIAVAQGEWVHLHNCRSLFDRLSSKLDVETGSRNETRYV